MRTLRGLAVGALILWLPLVAQSQFPGGGMPGGGRGGFSMGSFDPDQIFNSLSKGKDVIVISELDGFQKTMVERMAQRAGITNGQITRDQYKDAMKQLTDRMRSGGFGGMGGPPGPGAAPAPGGAPAAPANLDAQADEFFERQDRDRDGLLSNEEMTDALRSEKEKWDTNKDGFMDKMEYRPYFVARIQAIRQDMPTSPAPSTQDPQEEEDRRAIMFRAGKYPKDIPAWFAPLDTDGDGQVGVYEWRKSGRSLKELKEYDRNGDNFITIEEVVLVERLKAANATAVASSNGQAGSGGTSFGPPGGMNFGGQGGNRAMTFGSGGPGGGDGGFGGRGGFGGPRGFGGGGDRGSFGPGGFGGGFGNGGPGGGDRPAFGGGGPGGGDRASFGGGGSGGGDRGGPGMRTRGGPGGDRGSRGSPDESDRPSDSSGRRPRGMSKRG